MNGKKIVPLYVTLCIAIAMTTAACQMEPGNPAAQVLSGTVRTLSGGSVVSGAQVSANGVSALTDAAGAFSLNVPGGLDNAVVSVRKPGFGLYSKTLATDHNREVVISPNLVPADFTMTIDPGLAGGNILQTTDGAKVVFPDLSGAGITEDLSVTIVHYNVSSEELESAPGNFRGQTVGGETVNIVSQGMIEVDVRGEATGNTYSFQGQGYSFEITLPVTGDPAFAPDTIPLWYYNETTGLWVQEGTAAKTTDPVTGDEVYVGTVSHFTVWNMDCGLSNSVTAHGTIADASDDVYDLTIRGPGVYHPECSMEDRDLTIINMAPNADMELTIVKRSTGRTNVISFTTPATGTIELGDLMADYYSFVQKLQYYHEADAVYFSWQDPAVAGYTGLQISYVHENGGTGTAMIPAGTTTWTLSGQAAGWITFSLAAQYSGGKESPVIVRKTKIGADALLTMKFGITELERDDIGYFHLYYSYGFNTGYIEYTAPVLVPLGVTLFFKVEPIDLPDPDLNLSYGWYDDEANWYGGQEASLVDDDTNTELTCYFSNCGV